MPTILVVDDSEFLRMRVTKALNQMGYTTLEADNGLNAVQKFQVGHPDVVLLDITMPEMDGLGALKEIRGVDAGAKVIMLTAIGQESVVLEALRLGATDFVVKPFDLTRVLTAINKALDQLTAA